MSAAMTAALFAAPCLLFASAALLAMPADRRALHIVFALISLSILTLPRSLLGSTELDSIRVGVAGAEPRIMTYTVGLLAGIAVLFLEGERRFGLKPLLPLAIFLLVWPPLFWPHTEEVQAGVLHLLHAMLAWALGWGLASSISRTPDAGRIVTGWILTWMSFQALICAMQFLGSTIFSAQGIIIEDASLAGRAGGTLGHPSTIGKAVFIALLAVLPYIASRDRSTRRLAGTTLIVSAIPLITSGGRANALAAIALVGIWIFSDQSFNRWTRRFVAASLAGVMVLVSAPMWIDRFATGENGTFRARFNRTALEYLDSTGILMGSGANTYVTSVGPTDSMAALGWIVHNLYLLYLVEIGLVGLSCLLFPLILAIKLAFKNRRGEAQQGAAARALLGWVPGGLLITLTGWGMASDSLVAWFLFTSFAAALTTALPSQSLETGTLQTRKRSWSLQ